MRVELGLARGAKGDKTRSLLKRASTAASNKWGIGGREKSREKVKPITLAKITFKEADK